MGNKRIRKILMAGALAAALVLAAPSILDLYRGWQAKRLSVEALQLLQAGRPADAAEQVRMAYFLAPRDLSVVRTAARVAQASSAKMALPMWEEALEISSGEIEDQLGLGEAAVEAGYRALAEEMLTQIRENGARPGYALYLEGRMLALEGRIIEAGELLIRAWETGDAPGKTMILLGKLAKKSGNDALLKRTEGILRKEGTENSIKGLEALRLLGSWPDPEQETLRMVSTRLREHPLAGRDDLLAALLIDHLAQSISEDKLVEKAAGYFDLVNDDELLALVRWLIKHDRSDAALAYLEGKEGTTREDLFQAWAEAMFREKRFDALATALEDPEAPVASPLRHLFRMRVYRAQNEMRQARIAWEQAMEAAADDPDALWLLARQTMTQGLREQARDALWKLRNDPRVMRMAYQGLLEIDQSVGNTRGLLDILEQMSASYPRDNAIRNDFAYIQVLLNENVQTAISAAEALVTESESVLAYRVTLACGRMRQGKKEEALELLSGLDVRWETVRARWQIILAWILLENGQEVTARKLLDQVDEREPLLPEERGLLMALRWELEPGIALPLPRPQS